MRQWLELNLEGEILYNLKLFKHLRSNCIWNVVQHVCETLKIEYIGRSAYGSAVLCITLANLP